MSGFDSKRQASKDLLEPQSAKAVADEQSWDAGLWFVATTVTEAHLQAALRRLSAAVEGTQAANPWREAIDAELICTHIGTADSFPTAQDALAALIDWHVQVALDPEVSSDAQALIDRGADAVEILDEVRAQLVIRKGLRLSRAQTVGYDEYRRIGIKGSKT